jgi:hypothetical protein
MWNATLNDLIRIVNFSDWREYKEHINSCNTTFVPESINVQNLEIGKTINLGWVPEYYMKVEYKGNNLFEVKKCFGDFKKKESDTFHARKFILLNFLSHEKENIGYRYHPVICATMDENETTDLSVQEF